MGWFDAESQGVEQFRCCWVLAFCKQDHSHKSDYLHNQELLENQFYKSLSHNVLVQRIVYPILQTGAVVNQFVCLLREFLMKKIWNQSLQTWSCYSWSWQWVRRLSSQFANLIHCFSYSQMLFQTRGTDPLTWNAKSRCQTTPTIVKSIYASEQRLSKCKRILNAIMCCDQHVDHFLSPCSKDVCRTEKFM